MGRSYRLEDEHAIVRAQQLSDQQLEELLLDSSSVDAVLPDEVHPKGLEHVPGLLPRYLIQRILHHMTAASRQVVVSTHWGLAYITIALMPAARGPGQHELALGSQGEGAGVFQTKTQGC